MNQKHRNMMSYSACFIQLLGMQRHIVFISFSGLSLLDDQTKSPRLLSFLVCVVCASQPTAAIAEPDVVMCV
jgi:hypothetical protein